MQSVKEQLENSERGHVNVPRQDNNRQSFFQSRLNPNATEFIPLQINP